MWQRERRRHDRLPTRAFISVTCPRGVFTATMADISQGGARLLGVPEGMLARETPVTLYCGRLVIAAVVRWLIDDTCGVAFSAELTEAEIEAVRRHGLLQDAGKALPPTFPPLEVQASRHRRG